MAAKPVVAGTDGSEESVRAVDWAAREAVLRGLSLRIVSALALPPRMLRQEAVLGVDTVSSKGHDERDRALAAAVERAAAIGPDLQIDTASPLVPPTQALVEAGADSTMLVVGARGVGAFTAMLFGSVSRYVSAHTPCPVVVVREETAATTRQVGVGVGDLTHGDAALAFAFEEASLRQASLIALHAWDQPGGSIG